MRCFNLLSAGVLGLSAQVATAGELSDDEIRRVMIEDSMTRYSGSCPCPDSRTRNGRRCGRLSAYSRPGGESPLCYPEDVTDEMVQQWKAHHQ